MELIKTYTKAIKTLSDTANKMKNVNNLIYHICMEKISTYERVIKDLEIFASSQNKIVTANEQKERKCAAQQRFSECHIHSDNVSGCLDCGNYE